MQKVKEWLDGSRNFIIGRAIYKALGRDPRIIKLIEKGCTDFALQELVNAMELLLAPASEIPENLPAAAHSVHANNVHVSYMADSTNHVLQAIKNEWLPIYKKMCYLQGQLDKYGKSNSVKAVEYREPIADQILELEQKCIKIWKKREYFLEHGRLPQDKKNTAPIPTDPVELATLLSRTKRNIRTNRQQMALHPDKSQFAKKYLDYKLQYQQITGKQYQEVENE